MHHPLGGFAALRTIATAHVAVVIATLLGCGTPSAPQPGALKSVATPLNELFHDHRSAEGSQSIDIYEPIDVEIRNFAGDVVLRGHHAEGGARRGSLTLTRRAVHGRGRADEAEASLAEIAVRTELREVMPGRFLLTIESTTSHREPWFQRVDIDLDVAQLGAVTVATSRGHVDVRESDHGCHIETTKGTCRFITRRAILEPMTIVTSDSAIEVRLPPGTTAEVDAETVGGTVYSRITAGRWLLKSRRTDGDSLHADLNGGDNRMIFRTSDANIYFSVTERPDTAFSLIDEL